MIVTNNDKNKNMLRDYTLRLVAGIPQSINVEGKSYYLLEANGAITVKIDDGVEVERVMGQGAVVDFNKITFLAPRDTWIRVTLGTGYFVDNSGFFVGVDESDTYERTTEVVITPNSRFVLSDDSFGFGGLPDRPRLKDIIVLADPENPGEVDILRHRIVTTGNLFIGNSVTIDGETFSVDEDDYGAIPARGYRLYAGERVKYKVSELWVTFRNYNAQDAKLHLTMRYSGRRFFWGSN